ncbi:cupin-like domain-containing protein [Hephaestia sp. GCM10023244]|uniref:cupin-like domain-containing protein n=1 Tax=unclassified Hephaestia TaxID=2631281 RepID=UPI00207786FE|nr:cupin-like domain-containing protein [Hephaestia sp. MAHUQ-44]MCM8732159.1 cupin-like domain-containing protein [Hephaestia sp. MAHUQ-44]
MAEPPPLRRTRVIEAGAGRVDFEALLAEQTPTVIRGLGRALPLVAAGLESPEAAMAYIARFDAGFPLTVFTGRPDIKGRYFYKDDLTALDFEAERMPLGEVFARIVARLDDPDGPSIYVGSTDLDHYFPGLGATDTLDLAEPMFADHPPLVSIWMGNRTVAATHYDMSNNIACAMVGRRRFTLFPPDQVANLYPGPLEPTPGGQVVSMVDARAPDLDRFPRFAEALAAAEIADLEPGDALIYPALWWHQVEALDRFNVLINYWWNKVPAFMDTPMTTLLHGLLSLRDRPDHEKQAWRAMFDYYVFGDPRQAGAHLPPQARGDLAPIDAMRARRLRAKLLQRLNR